MSKTDHINFEEIRKLSSDEFKKKILTWIEEQGISEELQSRLRCGLIENFNKTSLGIILKSFHLFIFEDNQNYVFVSTQRVSILFMILSKN